MTTPLTPSAQDFQRWMDATAARGIAKHKQHLLAAASAEEAMPSAHALLEVGGEAGVAALLAVLENEAAPHPSRAAVAAALGQLGRAASPALPALQRLAKDARQGLQKHALAALRSIK